MLAIPKEGGPQLQTELQGTHPSLSVDVGYDSEVTYIYICSYEVMYKYKYAYKIQTIKVTEYK